MANMEEMGTNPESQGKDWRNLARTPDGKRPAEVNEKHWRRERCAHGHMVVIRSHFKSIYLIPMAFISLVCGVAVSFGEAGDQWQRALGIFWVFSFMFYMNIFIFEWNRAWTVALIATIVTSAALGFAVNSESFPVWRTIWDILKGMNVGLTQQAYVFFSVFFALCAMVSYIKTRLHYIVMEHNEMQVYRNAFFGDRERISMLNPSIEVQVPDMIEYFHPFYHAGTVVIHGPQKTIVLENVLDIRSIERITDKLGSTLSVRVEDERHT